MSGVAPVLEVEGLSLGFRVGDRVLPAVEDMSFSVGRGETVALVGESGCGKSITALTLMGLLPMPPAILTAGRIGFAGQDLARISEGQFRKLRGNAISMIFQEPMTALNPVMRLGDQIAEVLLEHGECSRDEAPKRALKLLRDVQLTDPEQRLRQYPHEISGGMRQRVMIAMALACEPQLLIADEPTTALDVTVQAQILKLMRDLKESHETALLLITHDLGVVAEAADRVVVMYAGRVVETASLTDLLTRPRHPYTKGLIGAIPRLGKNRRGSGRPLTEIAGTVPPLHARGKGCVFRDRCKLAIERCAAEAPPLDVKAPGHKAACFRSDDVGSAVA